MPSIVIPKTGSIGTYIETMEGGRGLPLTQHAAIAVLDIGGMHDGIHHIGEDDKILGFTMIGPEAGEVMGVVQIAMMGGLPYTALANAIIAHPTMAEGLNVLFNSSVRPAFRPAQ